MADLILDLETVAIPEASDYLEPPSPPSNYKDPEKIDAWVTQRCQQQLAEAALDIDLARIVALGYTHSPSAKPVTWICRDEDEERHVLMELWTEVRTSRVVGFNCLGFDVPMLIRRSQLLGVKPGLSGYDLNKYRMGKVLDLMHVLCFSGVTRYRSLDFYCHRFGINVNSDHGVRGKDIAQLVAENDWAGIEAHCAADVERTARLAKFLGVLE